MNAILERSVVFDGLAISRCVNAIIRTSRSSLTFSVKDKRTGTNNVNFLPVNSTSLKLIKRCRETLGQ